MPMCWPEGQEMSELLPDRKRSLVCLLLLLFKKAMHVKGMDCGRLTHFGTCWVNNLPKALPPTWMLMLLWYILWFGPERLPWEVVDEMPHLVDCRLGCFFNSSIFSLLTGLSPQWRKPLVTTTNLAIASDPNVWADSFLTAGKWSGEFLLILL